MEQVVWSIETIYSIAVHFLHNPHNKHSITPVPVTTVVPRGYTL